MSDRIDITVVIRDDSPLVCAGSYPVYRTVRIALTPEQSATIDLRVTGKSGGADIRESVAMCILEEVHDA